MVFLFSWDMILCFFTYCLEVQINHSPELIKGLHMKWSIDSPATMSARSTVPLKWMSLPSSIIHENVHLTKVCHDLLQRLS